MILEKDFKEQNNEIIGKADERIEMGVDTENINHLMMIMSSNLYQNPIGSIIREYTSNAIDANVEAKSDNPVVVRLMKDVVGNYFFEVQDYGPGLDDVDFRNVISKYGKSTKRDSNDQLGFFGLGCKSAFSYTTSFNYTCIKGGKERKYLLYKAETGFTIDLLNEKASKEKTGVIVRIPVKSWDVHSFRNEIQTQLAYFDNVYFQVDGLDLNKDYTLFQSQDFQWSSMYKGGEMHVCLGRVNYPIDWKALNLSPLYTPIGLKFGLDSGIFPIPNRENLIWNDGTKALVKKRISDVADWFVKKYNEQITEMPSLVKAWKYINISEHYVKLEGQRYDITELEKLSTLKFKDPIIKGIELFSPSFYKSQKDNLLDDYRVIGHYYNRQMHTKDVNYNSFYSIIDRDSKHMLLDDNVTITGFFREFLKNQGHEYFVKYKIDVKRKDEKYYEQTLGLAKYPQKDWKKYIKEYKKVQYDFIKDVFTDGTKLHESSEYKKFWEESKSKKKSVATSKALTKTREDVSILYTRPKAYGHMFERNVFKLDSLICNKFITVIVNDEEGKDINDLIKVYSKKNVKFAKIGIQDYNKIRKLKLHNFMTLKELERTRVYRKAVTALKAKQLCETYETLMGNKLDIVKECVGKFKILYKTVSKYINDNTEEKIRIYGNVMLTSMISTAETADLWDPEFAHVLKEFEKGLDDYSFITVLKTPTHNDDITVEKEYSKLVNNLLLFKKLRYENKLENIELCVKNSVPLDETKLVNSPVGQAVII